MLPASKSPRLDFKGSAEEPTDQISSTGASCPARNCPAKIFVNFFSIISTTERVDNSLYFPYTSAVVRASVKALW